MVADGSLGRRQAVAEIQRQEGVLVRDGFVVAISIRDDGGFLDGRDDVQDVSDEGSRTKTVVISNGLMEYSVDDSTLREKRQARGSSPVIISPDQSLPRL